MPRRSYDQFCAIARALDVLGERWTLLIVRELLGGARRYSDLLADLPGISTDVLAARLREMDRDGLLTRRPIGTRGTASAYELTEDGYALTVVVQALSGWGSGRLDGRGSTDAVRGHWFALPLALRFRETAARHDGAVEVRLEEGVFHVTLDPVTYAGGPAPRPDAVVAMDLATAADIASARLTLPDAVRTGRATVTGETTLAGALSRPVVQTVTGEQ